MSEANLGDAELLKHRRFNFKQNTVVDSVFYKEAVVPKGVIKTAF